MATGSDRQALLRMRSIICSNNLSYIKAKLLASDYKAGKIPPGYIGHKYLCHDIGYRIITAYGNGDGFICGYYTTPKDAWQDPRIQSRIKEAGVQQYGDYTKSLATVDAGRPWQICIYTILRCHITVRGNILAVKKK